MVEPFMRTNGNHYPCPICKKNPRVCPHSIAEMDARVWENHIRKIVRDEIKKALEA